MAILRTPHIPTRILGDIIPAQPDEEIAVAAGVLVEAEVEDGGVVVVVVRSLGDEVNVFAAEAELDATGEAVDFFEAILGLVAEGGLVVDGEGGAEPVVTGGEIYGWGSMLYDWEGCGRG